MKATTIYILISVLCLSSYKSAAQKSITPQLLEHIDSLHQTCLDSGANMWNCANDFNNQMDSLLNVVYRNVKSKLTPEQFQTLKQEQLKWIRKRDDVYSKTNNENTKDGLSATDASMAALDQEAEFVKERILYLLKVYQ